MRDPCAGIRPFSDEDVIKGEPRIIAQNQATAGISRDRINCDQYNAIHFDVLVSGGSSAVDLTVEGCYAEGGVYATIADPQGTRSVTASESFDVVIGSVWAQVRLGVVPAGQSYTIWATPWVAGGMPTVNANIVVDTLSAIQVNTGALNLSGFLTIGTDGGIYQGTGSAATPTTGLKLWNDGGIGRIAGYNGGTVQWYADTDGKLYAGGGKTLLDSNGITIIGGSTQWATGSTLKWKVGSKTFTEISGVGPSNRVSLTLSANRSATGSNYGDVSLTSYNDAGQSTYLTVAANGLNSIINLGTYSGTQIGIHDNELGFFGADPVVKPTVTGAKGGNAALGSLLTALATLGLITDSSGA